jgi:hypothetical protein
MTNDSKVKGKAIPVTGREGRNGLLRAHSMAKGES